MTSALTWHTCDGVSAAANSDTDVLPAVAVQNPLQDETALDGVATTRLAGSGSLNPTPLIPEPASLLEMLNVIVDDVCVPVEGGEKDSEMLGAGPAAAVGMAKWAASTGLAARSTAKATIRVEKRRRFPFNMTGNSIPPSTPSSPVL